MHKDCKKILLSKEEIHQIVVELGLRITKDYQGKKPLFVGLLKGSVPFFADLIREVELDLEIDFMDLSSYHGTTSTHEVIVNKDLETPITGRDVIIVEDIYDTGYTLEKVLYLLNYRQTNSIEVVTLLNKVDVQKYAPAPKYVGVEIPNEFVIGYGLDYNEDYRQLPYIGVLKEEVYMK